MGLPRSPAKSKRGQGVRAGLRMSANHPCHRDFGQRMAMAGLTGDTANHGLKLGSLKVMKFA